MEYVEKRDVKQFWFETDDELKRYVIEYCYETADFTGKVYLANTKNGRMQFFSDMTDEQVKPFAEKLLEDEEVYVPDGKAIAAEYVAWLEHMSEHVPFELNRDDYLRLGEVFAYLRSNNVARTDVIRALTMTLWTGVHMAETFINEED